MPKLMQQLLYPYLAPAGGDGDGGGGSDDRGDDFIPTGEDKSDDTPPKKDENDDTPSGKDEDEDDSDNNKKDDEDEDPDKKPDLKPNEELDEKGRPRSKSIPRIRFDKAMEKAKAKEEAYRQRIEELEAAMNGDKKTVEFADMRKEIAELQDKYEDLILDGKKNEARKVREQLEAARDRLVEMRTTQYSDAAKREAIDELKYDAALANFESQHPALNPEHEDFDEEVTNEVAMLMSAFVARGFTRHAALNKAVKYVVGNAPRTEDTDVLRKAREQEARRKAAKALEKTPPSMGKTGLDSDKAGGSGKHGIDVMRLSQDKFAKLDEETKAALRGDEL